MTSGSPSYFSTSTPNARSGRHGESPILQDRPDEVDSAVGVTEIDGCRYQRIRALIEGGSGRQQKMSL